jgi:hypothetical protein
MKEIPLTQGMVAIVEDCDYDELVKHKWFYNCGYAMRKLTLPSRRVAVRMHRQVLGLSFDDPRFVDHINHDGLDNRHSNLRVCNRTENAHNQISLTGTSKYKGVHKNVRSSGYVSYSAHIRYHKVLVHLGTFSTELDAACAYDAAAEWFFAAFSYYNLA